MSCGGSQDRNVPPGDGDGSGRSDGSVVDGGQRCVTFGGCVVSDFQWYVLLRDHFSSVRLFLSL